VTAFPPLGRRARIAASLAAVAVVTAACQSEPRRVEVGSTGGTATTTPPAAVIETVPPDAPEQPAAPTTNPPAIPATPAPPTTAPPEEEGPPVVLREDGLADTLRFGTKPDTVIAGLTLRWGPPESDSGWAPTAGGTAFGPECPGTQLRAVSWGRFHVLFTDGPSPHGPAGQNHFFSWVYLADNRSDPRPDPGGNRPRLTTAAGISVGSTVADLQGAYGSGLNLYDEHSEEGLATGGPGFAAAGMFGSLTSLDPGGRVSRIVGGGGCQP
jgi:hypothetical protein